MATPLSAPVTSNNATIVPRSPRTKLATMALRVGLCFLLQAFALLLIPSYGQKAEGPPAEDVQIEIVHVPEVCEPKSKKGDLLNAHYDGYVGSNKTKFYCR